MKMNTITKRTISLAMFTFILVAVFAAISCENTYAAIRLNKKSLNLDIAKTYKLKVLGTKAKVSWSSESGTVATVKKGVIYPKGFGKTVIRAKVKGKTLKCKLWVRPQSEINALALRKHILKKGKKGKGGSRYLRKKWSNGYDTWDVMVKVYKTKRDFYFKCHEVSDDSIVSDFIMTIDMIRSRAGDIKIVENNKDEAEKLTYLGTVGPLFCLDEEGYKDEKISLYRYEYGSSDPEVYTDPDSFSEETKAGFHMYTYYAFRRYDDLFKKFKLKSRMKNLEFEYFE